FTTSPGNNADDGVRSRQVTGVQPCALAISVTSNSSTVTLAIKGGTPTSGGPGSLSGCSQLETNGVVTFSGCQITTTGTAYKLHRSEERRVGKECSAFNITQDANNKQD